MENIIQVIIRINPTTTERWVISLTNEFLAFNRDKKYPDFDLFQVGEILGVNYPIKSYEQK